MPDLLRQACKQEYFLINKLHVFESQVDTTVVFSKKKEFGEMGGAYRNTTPEMRKIVEDGNGVVMKKNKINVNRNKIMKKVKNISFNIFERFENQVSNIKAKISKIITKKK